ncbi:MAG: hypothetical protein WBV39_13505 [Rudaea sp.]
MWRGTIGALSILAAGYAVSPATAQTVLPKVNVTARKWEQRHGGYLISSNFKVDPHMSAVIYPAEAFQRGDILSVQLTQMKDDEYFILQECVSDPCTKAHILRAWNAYGAMGVTAHNGNRVWIPHEGKFFMWMQRIHMTRSIPNVPLMPPSGSAGGDNSGLATSPGVFTGYNPLSPPLVFIPTGSADQFQGTDLAAARNRGPEKVVSSKHDGLSYAIKFASGTSVLIQRMHAAR